jgi:hypothetical protein
MATIAVSGYMLRHPLAGNIAAYLQYVLGLHLLGHDVIYLEEKGWAGSCYDPHTSTTGDFPSAGLELVRGFLRQRGVQVPVVWLDSDVGLVEGMGWGELRERLARTDLLLDVGGLCWIEERALARRRALVDMDPLFTQAGRFGQADYDVHFSYGANIGKSHCRVPTAGVEWLPTVPPVVPELWDAQPPHRHLPLTTVANWTAYGGIEHCGAWYGQKDREFERLRDLPARVPVRLELALSGESAQARKRFTGSGWDVRDAGEVTVSLPTYRGYIAGSQAELSAAKHAYVVTRSGWFSDRSVCYLAAGRPVIVQDTGIGAWLDTGVGVVTFDDVEAAADEVQRVTRELPKHSIAARTLALEVFDYRVVLPRLLERALPAHLAVHA